MLEEMWDRSLLCETQQGKSHVNEEKTEEENNGYVVFWWKIHGSAGKYGDGEGGEASFRMPDPFLL